MITQQHIDDLREYLGEENLRYFQYLRGLKGRVFTCFKVTHRTDEEVVTVCSRL